jgi:hypothetical protein
MHIHKLYPSPSSNIYSTNFTTTCTYTLQPDLNLLTELRILHYMNIRKHGYLEKWKPGYMHILLIGIQVGITQTLLEFITQKHYL